MKKIRSFSVIPSLPPELEPLRSLAYNLWWCWSHEAVLLFNRMDRKLWDAVEHNPVRLLGSIRQERLDELAHNDGFLAHMDRVLEVQSEAMEAKSWFEKKHPKHPSSVAYFSAEYGLTESLPIYSGGLGILAGDHIKSSSDLGIPLVGVGLLYRVGYFRQYLNLDGWQQELYPENDFYNMPLHEVRDEAGNLATVAVQMQNRQVHAQIWRLEVGRTPVYLLDTNLDQNHPEDRTITAQLYGGDLEMRIKQEILLGIGGQRALESLSIVPTVCHMNEGHSAFQALERIRRMMQHRHLSFSEARAAASAGNVFTTHTPVPAGNDMFPPNLVDRYFSDYWPQLGLDRDAFLSLGRIKPDDDHEPFCMTVLAIRLASYSNGVSKLHGDVSRKMWQGIWPEVPLDEVPIDHITNGVHTQTWLSRDLANLYDRYLGPTWRTLGSAAAPRTVDPLRTTTDGNGNGAEDEGDQMKRIWARVASIPDEELWRIHERLRARLVAFSRQALRRQLENRGAPRAEVDEADQVLDPEALTIGFARRFATYKRATLFLRDFDRLVEILGNRERPVQILIAGKAHPRDNAGKELIREIIHRSRDPHLRRRVVFLEDYSMSVARRLVQGVDIWLNTPRRPMEASGTSGMKCAANGALNLSIPDGWWCEAEGQDNGWTIGKGEDYPDRGQQDDVESRSLYDLLEKEVIPTFYRRNEAGLPTEWVRMMKNCLATIGPVFNTDRQVIDYTEKFYLPSADRTATLFADDFAIAKEVAAWTEKLDREWPGVSVTEVAEPPDSALVVNSALPVSATIHLGQLTPADVTVQLYYGAQDAEGVLQGTNTVIMEDQESSGDGSYRYTGAIPCRTSGRYGYAVRVLPRNANIVTPFLPDRLRWG